MHHQRLPNHRGISRYDSPVSALSTPSCLITSSVGENENDESHIFSCELICEQLKDSPSRNKEIRSRRRARRISRASSKGTRTRQRTSCTTKSSSQIQTTARRRSSAQVSVVRRLVSSISFVDGSDDEKDQGDGVSTVSSLGMSFLNESDEEDLHHEDVDAGTQCSDSLYEPEEESSIVRIKSQIKMLRRSSMERFQAISNRCSPKMCKADRSPSLPSSSRTRQDPLRDLSLRTSLPYDQTLHDERFQLTWAKRSSSDPLTTCVLTDVADDLVTTQQARRPSSLPGNFSKLVESDPSSSNGTHSAAELGLTSPSNRRRNFTAYPDRWCCSAASMIRDSELVRQSFERAAYLRKEQNDEDTSSAVQKDTSSCHLES
jgi:hypothetical protein